MKASELRIGNIVFHKGSQYQLRNITGVESNFVKHKPHEFWKVEQEDEISEEKDIVPILLTEKWLLEFGIVPHSKEWNGDIRCNLPDDRFEIRLYHDDNDCEVLLEGNTLTYIQYVHQLQNLYFALTGEELIV